ncbi:glutamine--fructose-6-phosphate transaminase (isomerizing) [Mangrovibacterium sp.]|uniref:glutamine--fructose-6-phosphate transaminase (isomerizing) n=1 Tax=Mangrovibacterium sp. TaxID=1961364 RepID=UPI00356309BB
MCGIVGYIGDKNAYPILIKGLQRLEYRGYDSAGIAIYNENLRSYKKKGKVSELEAFVADKDVHGHMGIGHTRWATHGEPSDRNAHPQCSMNNDFVLVHNGIIENYAELKKDLMAKGYSFQSETDTEVLVNLVEYFYRMEEVNSAEIAVRLALSKVVGAYGIVVLCQHEKHRMIAARMGSPLVIGLGQGEYFLASDASPIVEYTDSVIYMNDGDVAIIEKNSLTLKTLDNDPANFKITKVDLSIGDLEKGDFEHFMLKEIFEQPNTIRDTFRGRIHDGQDDIVLGGLMDVFPKIVAANRIIILGCGTSWHAALVAEYLIEEYARVPVEVEYASEFRYRKPIIHPGDVIIAVSQSGETADTLAALKMAKAQGAIILGICNVVGSSIARETDAGVYTHAGAEIGVASTKAFTAQVTVLTLFAFKLAKERGEIDAETLKMFIREMLEIPEKVESILLKHPHIKAVAEKYYNATNALYLGRGYLFPVALEGALKLKEISYIHAEGYAAGEMKHGPIALVDDNLPVVVVSAKDSYYEKVVSNIQEVKARKGNIIAVVTEGDNGLRNMADDLFEIPESHPAVAALLTVVPLQLFSYYIALMRGCDVDQPRNLAKSVTVE